MNWNNLNSESTDCLEDYRYWLQHSIKRQKDDIQKRIDQSRVNKITKVLNKRGVR